MGHKTEHFENDMDELDLMTETWLNDSFVDEQVTIYGFQKASRHDRAAYQGGGMLFDTLSPLSKPFAIFFDHV